MQSKLIFAALLAAFLGTAASVAIAGDAFSTGDSYGPRQPSGQTDGYAGDYLPRSTVAIPVQARSWDEETWSYQAASPLAYPPTAQTDINEQVRRYERHARRSYQQLIEDGGCNAPVVPFEYAIGCGTSASMQDVFGGAQSGQMGSKD